MWWSIKLVFQTETWKLLFLRASMVVTYYFKLFQTRVDRHNGILLSLLLLVAETITSPLTCLAKFFRVYQIKLMIFVPAHWHLNSIIVWELAEQKCALNTHSKFLPNWCCPKNLIKWKNKCNNFSLLLCRN